MSRFTVRVELSDEPGALGRLAASLGSVGVNIQTVDVQELDGSNVVDELVVEVPDDMWAEDVERRLIGAGARTVHVTEAVRPAVDAQVRCFDAAAALVRAARGGNLHTDLGRVLANVTRADVAWLELSPAGSTSRIAKRAADCDLPVTERVAELPSLTVPGPYWVMAVPGRPASLQRVGVLARGGDVRFSAAEIARARSVLWLADAIEAPAITELVRSG